MSMGVLYASVEITWRVVGRSTEETCEGKDGVMLRVRHLLIATDTFLCHEVRIGAAPTCRAVFVMDVNHDMISRAFLDGLVQPCCPFLRADLYEAELDSAHAPLIEARQDTVELLPQGPLIDIEPYTDAFLAGILAETWHVDVAVGSHTKS